MNLKVTLEIRWLLPPFLQTFPLQPLLSYVRLSVYKTWSSVSNSSWFCRGFFLLLLLLWQGKNKVNSKSQDWSLDFGLRTGVWQLFMNFLSCIIIHLEAPNKCHNRSDNFDFYLQLLTHSSKYGVLYRLDHYYIFHSCNESRFDVTWSKLCFLRMHLTM